MQIVGAGFVRAAAAAAAAMQMATRTTMSAGSCDGLERLRCSHRSCDRVGGVLKASMLLRWPLKERRTEKGTNPPISSASFWSVRD